MMKIGFTSELVRVSVIVLIYWGKVDWVVLIVKIVCIHITMHLYEEGV